MPTRRDLLKGCGAAVVGSLAAASLPVGTADAATVPAGRAGAPLGDPGGGEWQLRRGGPGPLYWSTYDYENVTNTNIPEDVWKANVDWVASTFQPHGYSMVCTDGWINQTQSITKHGYIRSLSDSWTHDWAWWVRYLAARHMQLGVYYNPMWATESAIRDRSITVAGRPDVAVADLVDPNEQFGAGIYWIDVTRDGAEEYVKGYVQYFRDLGVVFFRVDFLAWFEAGFDQNDGTVGVAQGTDGYQQALSWMREAAGDAVQLSLVMPNLFDHGDTERRYGDLVRIDNDVASGGWTSLSGGSQDWQPIWSQWNNPFLGFTGFSDVSGRGQLILDGDPLIMSSFANDAERQTAISLFTMAGAPIAITDQYDTIGPNASFYQNAEVLAVRKAGLVGKPVYHNSHGYFYDTSSRDPERWTGQLPDGSWVVGLFNRDDGPAPTTKSIDFATELGLSGPAAVRDLWAHRDLGTMTAWQVDLQPHASALVKVVAQQQPVHYQANVGAWSGTARFDNAFAGYEGLGYVTGLDTAGSSVTLAVAAPSAGRYRLESRVANATGRPASLQVETADPDRGQSLGSARLTVPSTKRWTTWQTATAEVPLGRGTNLVVLRHTDADQGSVNVDSVALRTR